jgi:hypothetical protein
MHIFHSWEEFTKGEYYYRKCKKCGKLERFMESLTYGSYWQPTNSEDLNKTPFYNDELNSK